MIEKMNAEMARLKTIKKLNRHDKVKNDIFPIDITDNVLPLGQQPEGNLDAMGKLEEARDELFKSIDVLGKNFEIYKQKNAELEEGVKELVKQVKILENKNGHK